MEEANAETNLIEAVPFFAVSNMKNSLRFYVEGLGFEMAHHWTEAGTVLWCWLRRGGTSLMLQHFRRENGASWIPEGQVGLGVSIMFICHDALAIYHEATARGLQPSRPFVGNGMWVTTLRDPDGYSVEFESYTETPEETIYSDDAGEISNQNI